MRSALLLPVCAGLALAACSANPGAGDAELREFAGSYPREASPTGRVRAFDLVAAPTSLPLLDGQLVEVWAYDGQVPGPTLRITLGDTLRVRFTNKLPQPTTVHWHGVRVPNAMDGVPGVTQPPVEPGQSFTYEFTPKDAGTYWFHPHLRSPEQVERGLYGVLVVEERDPPPWSRELVWVLDDWLMRPDGKTIVDQFVTRHDLMHDGRWGNVVTVNGDRHAKVRVKAGERIRVRLLDTANGRVFAPDFGALDVKVIAVDGKETARPLPLTGFELAPGNRLDLDVTVPPSLRGQRVTIVDRFTREVVPLVELEVEDAVVPTPTFAPPARAHVPAWRNAGERPLRHEFRLDSRLGGAYGIQWTIDGQAMEHDEKHGMGHVHDHELVQLPRSAFSRVRFTNASYRLHPMHIHGMFFRLLSRNGRPVDEPFFRDTVLLHPQESIEVGVVPEDVGRWMMHCHILEHAEAGMMTLVEVK